VIPLNELDRYRRPSPYDVLGVGPDASAREIVGARNNLKRDLQEKGGDPAHRAKEMQRIEAAYDQLCKADLRVRIDFFLLDPKLFLKQTQAIAQRVPKPKAELEGVFKPRQIRVTHAALIDELKQFFQEPPRVGGLFHRPMEFPADTKLPEPLAIQFDC
jgi:hypothetical protein